MKLPRFSLRKLFIAIAVVALYLGWQMAVVQERRYLLREIKEAGGDIFFDAGDNGEWGWAERATFVRRMLGDRSMESLLLPYSMKDRAEHVAMVFPEINQGYIFVDISPLARHDGATTSE